MTSPFVDPAAMRTAYERQLALLIPVVDGLQDAATGPDLVAVHEWRGPAAAAAVDFLRELRAALQEAARRVDDQVRELRHRAAELS